MTGGICSEGEGILLATTLLEPGLAAVLVADGAGAGGVGGLAAPDDKKRRPMNPA